MELPMPDRRKQIILLISSRFDFDPQPETFTGKVVRRAATAGKGGSPSHWQPCQSCDGGSRRNRFGKLEPCEACNGQGRVRVDDYTGDTVVTDEGTRSLTLGELIRKDTRTVKCPDCQTIAGDPTGVIRGKPCRRCGGTGHAPVAGSWLSEPADPDRAGTRDQLDAMLNALERKQEAGSYAELEQAMRRVYAHANKPLRYAAVTVYARQALRLLDDLWLPPATREPDSLSGWERDLAELTLAYLDTQMPDPIRVPADVTRNAKEQATRRTLAKGRASHPAARRQRDKEIRRHARDGKGPQWIAQEYGLSVSTVYVIVNGTEAAA